MGRWIRYGLVTVLIVVVAGVLWGVVRRGATKELARRPGQVLRLAVSEQGLCWLETTQTPRQKDTAILALSRLLYQARGAASPTVLVEAPGIADFCVRDAVYYVTNDSLAKVPLTGGSPTTIRGGLQHPKAVLVGDDWICWTETLPARSFSLFVLPLTRPTTLLRAMHSNGGDVQTLSSTDGEGEPTLRLLEIVDGALYWAEYRRQSHISTLLKRIQLPHAAGAILPAETLSAEDGKHESQMRDGSLYSTGESREGAPAAGFSSVSRRGPDGRVELLGEWLPPEGVLRLDDGRVYYCRQGIYELPGNAGLARKVVPDGAADALTQILHDNAYLVVPDEEQGYRIMRRALHGAGWWAARRGVVP